MFIFSKGKFGSVGNHMPNSKPSSDDFCLSSAFMWCSYHFSSADIRVSCVGISGEEIPDGATPPPINGTLAPGPGECVYTMLQTFWSVPTEFKWVLFGNHLFSVWALFHVKLVNLICLDKGMFPLTFAHWNVTAAPAESIYRLLECEQ